MLSSGVDSILVVVMVDRVVLVYFLIGSSTVSISFFCRGDLFLGVGHSMRLLEVSLGEMSS